MASVGRVRQNGKLIISIFFFRKCIIVCFNEILIYIFLCTLFLVEVTQITLSKYFLFCMLRNMTWVHEYCCSGYEEKDNECIGKNNTQINFNMINNNKMQTSNSVDIVLQR